MAHRREEDVVQPMGIVTGPKGGRLLLGTTGTRKEDQHLKSFHTEETAEENMGDVLEADLRTT